MLNSCEKIKQGSGAFRLVWAETYLIAGSQGIAMMSKLRGSSDESNWYRLDRCWISLSSRARHKLINTGI